VSVKAGCRPLVKRGLMRPEGRVGCVLGLGGAVASSVYMNFDTGRLARAVGRAPSVLGRASYGPTFESNGG